MFNDFVFFCGEHTAQKVGILGFFKLSNLISGTTVTYKTFFFNNRIENFYRLTVYSDDNSQPRVVAIGRNIPATGQSHDDIILDCRDMLGTPTFEMKSATITTNLEKEDLCDICYTGRHVVTVGSYYDLTTGDSYLCLRRCDSNHPLYGIIDTLHLFPESKFVSNPELFCISLPDDEVAVSYRGEVSTINTHYLRLRVFDISGSYITNTNSQHMNVTYKGYVHEMAYLEDDRSIVQLEDYATTSGFTSNFVHLYPYIQTGYTTNILYDESKRRYQSVSALDGRHFVGTGCLYWLYRDIFGPLPAPSAIPPINLCPKDETTKIAIINNLTPRQLYNPQAPGYLVPILQNDPQTVTPNITTTNCKSTNK